MRSRNVVDDRVQRFLRSAASSWLRGRAGAAARARARSSSERRRRRRPSIGLPRRVVDERRLPSDLLERSTQPRRARRGSACRNSLLGLADLGAGSCWRSSSVRFTLRENFCASMTMPSTPGGISSESFFTSSPARPKIACSSFSSGVSSLLLFGATLPTRMSPGVDARCRSRTMPVSSRLRERLLADVRDVARELLAAELRLADLDLELLDVDRGEDVVLDEALGDEDRVLEVVAVPGHERDEHVACRARARRRCVAAPSARTWPFLTFWPSAHDRLLVRGRCARSGPTNLRRRYSSSSTRIAVGVDVA